MIFDFLFKKKLEETALLIDIGNGSIGLALAIFCKGTLPTILYSHRSSFRITDRPNTKKLMEEMSILVDRMLGARKSGSKKIDAVLITFSSPWYELKTKTVNFREDTAFNITSSFLDAIAEKEGNIFVEELSKEFGDDTFAVIDKNIVHTTVNGYALEETFGRKTKIFEVFLSLSVIPKSITDKICNVIFRHTHIGREQIIIHTFPLVLFFIARDIFPLEGDFIIMDITGEVTDLTLVLNNAVNKNISFPYGRNFLIRQIGKSLGVSLQIAESTLSLHLSGKTDSSKREQIRGILSNAVKEWADCLERKFLLLSMNTVLPRKIYVTSDSDTSSLFMNFLKSPMEIVNLDQYVLSHLYKNSSVNPADEFLGFLTIFYNKVFK